ncbi:MAG TPA: hypothetical protein VMS21_15880 [Methylomirabilota bacterium]|nr:hypothetical protein [Methylomirabilota bacterium]
MVWKLRLEWPGAIHHELNRRADVSRCSGTPPILERLVEPLETAGRTAERLRMGSVFNVNTLPGHWRRDGQK